MTSTMKLKASDALITWNPGGAVRVVSKAEDRLTPVNQRLQRMVYGKQKGDKTPLLFIHFNTLVVRDGVSVMAVHREFTKIEEYCKAISEDQNGATWHDGELICARN